MQQSANIHVESQAKLSVGEPISLSIFDLSLQGVRWGKADGVPVLALHGWLDNANSFLPLANRLPHWHLVAPDLPGHGWSDHRALHATYHIVDWIKDILAIVNRLNWPRCVLMGHSMGGAIAALFAACFPERISHLVLLDGFGPISAPADHFVQRVQRHIDGMLQHRPEQLRVYKDVHHAARLLSRAVPHLSLPNATLLAKRNLRPVPGGMTWSYDGRLRDLHVMTLTEEQVQAAFRKIICPVFWVRPEFGYPFDEQALHQRQQQLQQVQSLAIAGGHHAHMDACPTLCKSLTRFVGDEHKGPSP